STFFPGALCRKWVVIAPFSRIRAGIAELHRRAELGAASFAGKFSSGRIPPGARGGDSLDRRDISLHPRRLVPVRVPDSATAWGSRGDDSATLPTSLPDLPPLRNAREFWKVPAGAAVVVGVAF